MSETLTVTVDPPRVEGDTIRFTWSQDDVWPEPVDGGLLYRFEGIDLHQFSDTLWMELFLALRLRAYARLGRRVVLRLPFPVPEPVASFWSVYHRAADVEIDPVSPATTYSPWRSQPLRLTSHYNWTVYFGGGRDSLATACLLAERYGPERVLLTHVIDPHSGGADARQLAAERMERRSLQPMRTELGFPVQRVWTNLHVITLAEGGKDAEPHLEQYTAGLLPVALARGIPFSTFCHGNFDYYWLEKPTGILPQRPASRPEVLAALSCHYQRVLGFGHSVANINLTMTSISSYSLLVRRFPEAAPWMTMCVGGDPSERWCYRCAKCSRHGWHMLAEGVDDARYHMNRAFAQSEWMANLVQQANRFAGQVEPGANVPWDRRLDTPLLSMGMRDLFHRADPDLALERLSGGPWVSYSVIQACYGNVEEPMFHMVPQEAFDILPHQLGEFLAPIIGQIDTPMPRLDQPFSVEGERGWHLFAFPYHSPLADLVHLQ